MARIPTKSVLLLVSVAWGLGQERPGPQRGYPPQLEGARTEVYKKVGATELKLWIYEPPGHLPTNRTPAIVFFFGGGWTNGTPAQFEQHCRYLASRGMVAMTADYRVASRSAVQVSDCIEDAK